jgi:glycerol-3-phosphate dehydrogenase (NAD(P)+)
MGRVAIIGGGAFGTGMACVARRSGNEVALWVREPEVVDDILHRRENTHFLAGTKLPQGIEATVDMARAADGADLVLMAVPAQHTRAVAGQLRPALRRGMPVVSCSKGVEQKSCQFMPEVLADMLPEAIVAVLSGPSFAKDIGADLPCGVVVACHDWAVAEMLARSLANPNFCVHLSDDVIGAAVAGAMKNVISIAGGIAHARNAGESGRASLVTLGLEEAARLGIAKGGRLETFLGLAGAGDFMNTAHSLQSRNTTLGIAIGEGRRAADVLAGRKQVTEGATNVVAVAQLARNFRVEMPITLALDEILADRVALEDAIRLVMRTMPALWRTGKAGTREVLHV